MAVTTEELLKLAAEARHNAHAPYSRFRVGAALLTADGRVFTGCNVENGSYGLTVCAERVAIFNAVSAGVRDFVAMAVVADTRTPTPPCGACLQVMQEFAPELRLELGNLTGAHQTRTLRELMPHGFHQGYLKDKP